MDAAVDEGVGQSAKASAPQAAGRPGTQRPKNASATEAGGEAGALTVALDIDARWYRARGRRGSHLLPADRSLRLDR